MSEEQLGFVGVGNMGGAMALRARERGVALTVFDLAPAAQERLTAAGATVVASPAEVARRSSVVSVVVNYDQDVIDAVLGTDGVLDGASPGLVIAIHSTIHLETLERVIGACSERGVTVVDAAVTGGVEAAQRGELAVLLGGSDDAVARVRSAIGSYASVVLHAGASGAGLSAKLAVNLIGFAKMAAAHEGLALAHAAGVDVVALAEVLAHAERQSGQHEFYLAARSQAFARGGDANLEAIGRHESPKSQKDLHAALELGRRVGVELPVAAVIHDLMPEVWAVAR
ncbi:MAG: NAD(P)-dependent oxidoreductase [Acidimicrobiales bacterium]|nr:NAD(P)-dependent oxidoreductase [Acidimicrobiales bacterium]